MDTLSHGDWFTEWFHDAPVHMHVNHFQISDYKFKNCSCGRWHAATVHQPNKSAKVDFNLNPTHFFGTEKTTKNSLIYCVSQKRKRNSSMVLGYKNALQHQHPLFWSTMNIYTIHAGAHTVTLFDTLCWLCVCVKTFGERWWQPETTVAITV